MLVLEILLNDFLLHNEAINKQKRSYKVNYRFKKILLTAVMLIILIAFFITLSHHNFAGELVCLGATGALFMAIRRKQNRKQ